MVGSTVGLQAQWDSLVPSVPSQYTAHSGLWPIAWSMYWGKNGFF